MRALELYRQAAGQRQSLWHQVELAQLMTTSGDAAAEAEWDALVANYAGYTDAWLERGWHYYNAGDYDRAIADYTQALALVPENEEAENRWAICLEGRGDVDGAVLHYRRAIGLNPAPTLYKNLITLVEAEPGREQEASALWDEFLSAFPNHPEALMANGDRLFAEGNYAAAQEVYLRGAKLAPGDERFPNLIGNCLWTWASTRRPCRTGDPRPQVRRGGGRQSRRGVCEPGRSGRTAAIWRSYSRCARRTVRW
jgi:tetratricopeptide (TPR) repeat protein